MNSREARAPRTCLSRCVERSPPRRPAQRIDRAGAPRREESGRRASTALPSDERLGTRGSALAAGALRWIVAIEDEVDRFLDERAQARAVAGGGLRQALELAQRDGERLRNCSAHGSSRRPRRKQVDFLSIIPCGNASSAAATCGQDRPARGAAGARRVARAGPSRPPDRVRRRLPLPAAPVTVF